MSREGHSGTRTLAVLCRVPSRWLDARQEQCCYDHGGGCCNAGLACSQAYRTGRWRDRRHGCAGRRLRRGPCACRMPSLGYHGSFTFVLACRRLTSLFIVAYKACPTGGPLSAVGQSGLGRPYFLGRLRALLQTHSGLDRCQLSATCRPLSEGPQARHRKNSKPKRTGSIQRAEGPVGGSRIAASCAASQRRCAVRGPDPVATRKRPSQVQVMTTPPTHLLAMQEQQGQFLLLLRAAEGASSRHATTLLLKQI